MSSSNGFQATAYAAERAPSTGSNETDLTGDPASSSFFASDVKKMDDLKQMLDGSKDNLKLDAMKKIIGMVARGKNCSELFPAVVKNVVSKNLEIKKLVYVYLTRYAEEQQDLALLSISTFQRALKDPNQLIRGSALRVLSSIRVPMIVPIMMLSIKEAASDMSPYVRKTAAHAIPKMYNLDPEQKDLLIEIIEKLLNDRTTLVAGSVIQAFEEVCPERIDLIHKHYRKLCSLLVDVEEWGQVVIINMFTRYVRSEFVDPNKQKVEENGKKKPQTKSKNKTNTSDSDESDDESSEEESDNFYSTNTSRVDGDHRLLLKNSKPLLNSRNSAVVMAVAQLYFHAAPEEEVCLVVKALVRLLRSHSEVQYVVLNNIASMTIHRRGLFEPYLKSFFVHSSDSTQVKLLKLEILTNMASESSIPVILKEFQSYVTSSDKEFAAATIQAIGRCASLLPEIMDTCMSGLIHLMSKKDETVVAESVVVLRKLLQMQSSDHKDIIVHMAQLVDTITVPMARASILWLIGEYADRIPKIAPDVLRKAAKTFCDEDDIGKLQILNLAAKLSIVNPKQTRLLVQYVLNVAKYDQNYDIRDRSRFLRALLFNSVSSGGAGGETANDSNNGVGPGYLTKHAKKILLATKPAPLLNSKFKDRPEYQLGTLSHLLNHRVSGYQPLPDWPEAMPDHKDLRDVPLPTALPPTAISGSNFDSSRSSHMSSDNNNLFTVPSSTFKSKDSPGTKRLEDFYSDLESDENEESTSNEDEDEDEDSDVSSDDSEEEEVKKTVKTKKVEKEKEEHDDEEEEESEEEDSDESSSGKDESSEDEKDSSSESEESDDSAPAISKVKPPVKAPVTKATKASQNKKPPPVTQMVDLLLDFDDPPQSGPTPSSIQGSAIPLLPIQATLESKTTTNTAVATTNKPNSPASQVYIPTNFKPKLNEIISRSSAALHPHGLAIFYRYSRSLSFSHPRMVCLELQLTNCLPSNSRIKLKDISIDPQRLSNANHFDVFAPIDALLPGNTASVMVSIDFQDSTQVVKIPLTLLKEDPRNAASSDSEKESDPDKSFSRDEKLSFEISIQPSIGELIQPTTMTETKFKNLQNELRGMAETLLKLNLQSDFYQTNVKDGFHTLIQIVYAAANISSIAMQLPTNEAEDGADESSTILASFSFAGSTASAKLPCLIQLNVLQSNTEGVTYPCHIQVNCEKITIGSQLGQELMKAINSNQLGRK